MDRSQLGGAWTSWLDGDWLSIRASVVWPRPVCPHVYFDIHVLIGRPSLCWNRCNQDPALIGSVAVRDRFALDGDARLWCGSLVMRTRASLSFFSLGAVLGSQSNPSVVPRSDH
jgi:hypothetical protein